MRAGFGDTVFVPLYLVLRDRGVRFEFFHRAERLDLAADHHRVETVRLARQADLKAELPDRAPGVPEPLGGPSVSAADRRQRAALLARPAPLRTDRRRAGRRAAAPRDRSGIGVDRLAGPGRGRAAASERRPAGRGDLDEVILASSLGPLGSLTAHWPEVPHPASLARHAGQPADRADPGVAALAPPDPAGVGPLRAAADATLRAAVQLPGRDGRRAPLRGLAAGARVVVPQSLTYFCGVLPDAPFIPPAYTQDPLFKDFPARQADRVRRRRWSGCGATSGASGRPPAAAASTSRTSPSSGHRDGEARRPVLARQRRSAGSATCSPPPAAPHTVSTRTRAGCSPTSIWPATGCATASTAAASSPPSSAGCRRPAPSAAPPSLIWGESDFQEWTNLPDPDGETA